MSPTICYLYPAKTLFFMFRISDYQLLYYGLRAATNKSYLMLIPRMKLYFPQVGPVSNDERIAYLWKAPIFAVMWEIVYCANQLIT